MMSRQTPKLVLYSRTRCHDHEPSQWQFTLYSEDGRTLVSANDEEPNVQPERLELLSVVRGVEAIDEPADVVLITSSRYVYRGVRFGLNAWRGNNWCWEHFGQQVPVKNQDLWKRLDRALGIHTIALKWYRVDSAQSPRSQLRRHHRGGSEIKPSRFVKLGLIARGVLARLVVRSQTRYPITTDVMYTV